MNTALVNRYAAPFSQRGAASVAIAFLILLIIGAALATALSMSGSAVRDAAMSEEQIEALFLAESGLEAGAFRYRSGTACVSPGSDLSRTLGSGSFALSTTTYAPAGTTLSSNIVASNLVIPVASIAGFATHGRIRIANEEINYTGVSSVAAACAGTPPCFIGAARGAVGSPTPATHLAGTAVNQNQCLIRSVGTTNNVRRTLEAATTVKRVQSNTVVMNPAAQTVTLPAAVDPGRSFVLCRNQTDDGDPDQRVTCELTDATTLTITSSQGRNPNVVQWYVVEFTSGIAVQRGVANFLSGSTTPTAAITLNPGVNLAKSFVLISERIPTGNENRDERWAVRANLTTSTNLELTRGETGDTLIVAWQVIQIEDATVQAGLTTLANGSATVTATIGAAVDVTKTFLVFSQRVGNAGGREERYQVRGELTNATTLTFTRAVGTNAVDIAWFAVTLNDGTTVQRGTVAAGTGAASATVNAALTQAIVINRSFPIISVSGGSGGNSDLLDDTSFTDALTTTTNLQLQRSNAVNSTTVPATAAWFVVNLGSPRIDWKEIIP